MIARVLLGTVVVLWLPCLLLAQPPDSLHEFLNGHRKTFSTKGHPKAKGVNFTIAYPNSWAAKEGERPNIVQKFVSEGGRGLEMAMIVTNELPLPPGTALTNEDLKELFAPSGLRGMLPPGAKYVDARSTQIEGEPAGILEFTMRGDRAGMEMLIHAWVLYFVSGNVLVQVPFSVSGVTGTEEDVSNQMARFKPLFTLMANSIVFPDKWTAVPGESAVVPTPLPRNLSSNHHADLAEMLGFMEEITDKGIALRNNYLRELDNIGWNTILDLNRISSDKGLIQSKLMLFKAKRTIDKYYSNTLTVMSDIRQKMEKLDINDTAKHNMLLGLESTIGAGLYQIEKIWDIEKRMVTVIYSIMDLLSTRDGAWMVNKGQILFDNPDDLSKFNSYIVSIYTLANELQNVENQNIEIISDIMTRVIGKIE